MPKLDKKHKFQDMNFLEKFNKLTSAQSTTAQPSSAQSTTAQPSSAQSTTAQPSSAQSTTITSRSIFKKNTKTKNVLSQENKENVTQVKNKNEQEILIIDDEVFDSSQFEKSLIINAFEFLSGRHISIAIQKIINRVNLNFKTKFEFKEPYSMVEYSTNFQIHIVFCKNHWITVTNRHHHYTETSWFVYDSLNDSQYFESAIDFLKKNGLIDSDISISKAWVIAQDGYADCGLFSLGYMIAIAEGINPANIHFNQFLMRTHFNDNINSIFFNQFINTNIFKLNYYDNKTVFYNDIKSKNSKERKINTVNNVYIKLNELTEMDLNKVIKQYSNYFSEISCGYIESWHHITYQLKTNKSSNLLQANSCIGIFNNDQDQFIAQTLLKYFPNQMDYVCKVLLPEACMKICMHYYNCEKEEAQSYLELTTTDKNLEFSSFLQKRFKN